MSSFFISHAAADGAKLAAELVARLEAAGQICWVAPRDVAAGRTYPAQIMAAIRDCRGVVLLVTPAANHSADVLQEVQVAHAQKKIIVPVIVGDLSPSDDLAFFLAVRHRIAWTTADAICVAVLQSLPATHVAPKAMNALDAIAAAAATEEGITGSFTMGVRATGSEGWLMSENDYRDPRCLSVYLDGEARRQLTKLHGEDPTIFFKGRTIVVLGTAKKQRIDFVSGGKSTGHYYYQTHVDVTDARVKFNSWPPITVSDSSVALSV